MRWLISEDANNWTAVGLYWEPKPVNTFQVWSFSLIHLITQRLINLSFLQEQLIRDELHFSSRLVIATKDFSSSGKKSLSASRELNDTGPSLTMTHECETCGNKLATKQSLARHVKLVHEKIKPFECPVCLKKFGSKLHLSKHNQDSHKTKTTQESHNTETTQNCSVGSFSTKFSGRLRRHILVAHEKSKSSLDNKCEICAQIFSSKYVLANHVKVVHEKVKNFECHICGRKYGNKCSLSQHFQAKHENKKSHQCGVCYFTTNYEWYLQRHILVVHKNVKSQENVQCDICGKMFASKVNLGEHVKVFHEKVKPFECLICGTKHVSNGSLSRHIRDSHESKRRYHCETCPFSTNHSSHMRRHIMTVHEKVRSFKCNHCRFSALTQSMVDYHIKRVHEKVKRYHCNICQYSCFDKAALQKHRSCSWRTETVQMQWMWLHYN